MNRIRAVFALTLFSAYSLGAVACDSPGDSDSKDGAGLCTASDPELSAGYGVNHDQWPGVVYSEDYFEPSWVIIAADCTVLRQQNNGGSVQLELVCSEGEIVDAPMSIVVAPPAGRSVPAMEGSTVTLHYDWNGPGHHQGEASMFALHDAESGELRVAGVNGEYLSGAEGFYGPLTLEATSGVCEPTCIDGGPGCVPNDEDAMERVAVTVSHEGGAAVDVLDGAADVLDTGDSSYHVSVTTAEQYSCINCWSQYNVLVLGQ